MVHRRPTPVFAASLATLATAAVLWCHDSSPAAFAAYDATIQPSISSPSQRSPARTNQVERPDNAPDFDRQLSQQIETDRAWQDASQGFMRMDKVVYRSRVGDLDIPAFVFQPLSS